MFRALLVGSLVFALSLTSSLSIRAQEQPVQEQSVEEAGEVSQEEIEKFVETINLDLAP